MRCTCRQAAAQNLMKQKPRKPGERRQPRSPATGDPALIGGAGLGHELAPGMCGYPHQVADHLWRLNAAEASLNQARWWPKASVWGGLRQAKFRAAMVSKVTPGQVLQALLRRVIGEMVPDPYVARGGQLYTRPLERYRVELLPADADGLWSARSTHVHHLGRRASHAAGLTSARSGCRPSMITSSGVAQHR